MNGSGLPILKLLIFGELDGVQFVHEELNNYL